MNPSPSLQKISKKSIYLSPIGYDAKHLIYFLIMFLSTFLRKPFQRKMTVFHIRNGNGIFVNGKIESKLNWDGMTNHNKSSTTLGLHLVT